MSASSPQDLVVAFRSLGRRLREAQEASEDDTSGAAERLRTIVQSSGRELGVSTVGDVGSMSTVVADAIAAVPADQWDPRTLERLRSLALEAGGVLRSISVPDQSY
jgi:hypothetical protein